MRASVPERIAILLTGHKSRAIFDRYNIIHEQELVAYLAQQAQTPRRRAHPASPRPARPSVSCDAPPRKRGPSPGTGSRPGHTYGPTPPTAGTRAGTRQPAPATTATSGTRGRRRAAV